ncbi:conserved hypothetical protein [Theileria equi strain WA]|uniref:Uncharacterized protein n=1 Tax=Theileria equi strain WA TaxID=1537102 RepID=L1LFM8_THEEQ|nr:conserved hypothetical protein [Theileria equi strain WA]EKX74060.1 conserved hypothetical protein [Theileria equi strain WA]|eukprot:XP_004833512.1 conserved hypothetical protein [Theileria equi strain WA]
MNIITNELNIMNDMLRPFSTGRNGVYYTVKRFLCPIYGRKFERNFTSHVDLATSIIRNAHGSFLSDSEPSKVIIGFKKHIEDLEGLILSKEEAICTMNMCLDLGHLNRRLFRNCIEIVEDEYFKPVLVKDCDKVHPLTDLGYKNIDNTYEFVNNMSIQHKALIVIWTHIINQRKDHSQHGRHRQLYKPSESIDPEKEEIVTTRKLGRVLDPKPIRARISRIPSGKKLSNMLALQLREQIPDASLSDACYISHIFTTDLPLSGQLNEDTIDLLAQRFSEFTPSKLVDNMYSISKFCRSATRRFNEIWSFHDPNVDRIPTKRRCLYKIERRQFKSSFVLHVLKTLELYCDPERNKKDTVNPYIYEKNMLTLPLHIMLDLSHSDIPIPINLWDKLVVKIDTILKDVKYLDLCSIGLFFEAVVVSKYTTENTIEVAKGMLKKCVIDNDKIETYNSIQYILKVVSEQCLENEFRDLIDALLDDLGTTQNTNTNLFGS